MNEYTEKLPMALRLSYKMSELYPLDRRPKNVEEALLCLNFCMHYNQDICVAGENKEPNQIPLQHMQENIENFGVEDMPQIIQELTVAVPDRLMRFCL